MAEAGTETPGVLGTLQSPWGSLAGTVRAGAVPSALPGSVSSVCSATAIVLLVRRSRVRLAFKGEAQGLDCLRTSKLIFLLVENYLSVKW